ncbi:hypothetical protein [Desulfoluna spongiiphila]|uniref:Uncharacterized protein n=1 Tax=Desulfoluna spongiiphila TaxID=419481 RepID=A0A1G5CHS2_9BACT|nr:hypothetical protein [Desulfoluna spongiiphila]SCY01841.1 hypothetical protein SAMN05216233_10324 [Desulfoluna spongiiphila]
MPDYRINQKVHYHPTVGGPHDGNEYTIRAIANMGGIRKLVWLVGKAKSVPIESLSHVEQPKISESNNDK